MFAFVNMVNSKLVKTDSGWRVCSFCTQAKDQSRLLINLKVLWNSGEPDSEQLSHCRIIALVNYALVLIFKISSFPGLNKLGPCSGVENILWRRLSAGVIPLCIITQEHI
jgi:hypothetical protein